MSIHDKMAIVVRISATRVLRNCWRMVALIGGWSTIGSAQLLTEAHDPVRGVHLSSIEVSNGPLINSWRVTAGDFSDIDRITIGLGAAVFDETTTVTEYTLWIAYEGRWWHGFDPERMLRLTIDGSTSIMELIRRPQPSIVGGRITEKFEFRIPKDQLDALLQGTEVSLTITLENGTAMRQLRSEEKESLRDFRSRVDQ